VTVIRIEGDTQWQTLRAKGGNWVGVCEPLGLTVQSDTWANLMEDIAQTLNAMLNDLVASGDLDRFLRDRGWRFVNKLPARPDDVWFDVPFMTRAADRDFEAALR
jgi:hypothetical protein